MSKISQSEYKVLKVIWALEPTTSREIINELKDEWTPHTIKTLISRLVKKEVVEFEKEGNRYIYHATVKEDAYKKSATKSFLDRVYNGSIGALVANVLQHDEFSKEELESLRNLLDQEGD